MLIINFKQILRNRTNFPPPSSIFPSFGAICLLQIADLLIFEAISRFPLQSFFSKKDFHCNRG